MIPAPTAEHIFALNYYGGFKTWTIDVYMVRHRDEFGESDVFTVHRADNRENLGWGDTKEEAIVSAQITMVPVAERQAFEAGLIDRPYGRPVRRSLSA